MQRILTYSAVLAAVALMPAPAQAQLGVDLLFNGNFDQTQEVDGQPRPLGWVQDSFLTDSGPINDGLSSEPWAGPPPTPVTSDASGLPSPDGCGFGEFDCGVFFKPFHGNLDTGDLVTANLFQDVPATPGLIYTLTGWAGAEANYSGLDPASGTRTELAVEFLDAANSVIGGSVLDLAAAGLGSVAGEPFGYDEYSVSATAPAGAVNARARVSMIDAFGTTGGQAFVVDDFSLVAIPEPAGLVMGVIGVVALLGLGRRRR